MKKRTRLIATSPLEYYNTFNKLHKVYKIEEEEFCIGFNNFGKVLKQYNFFSGLCVENQENPFKMVLGVTFNNTNSIEKLIILKLKLIRLSNWRKFGWKVSSITYLTNKIYL